MHVLFLSQVLPYPLDAGPKMRSYYVLRYLTQEHEVTLLTFVRDTDKPEDIVHLAEFCHSVYTVPIARTGLRDIKFLFESLLTGKPFLIVRDQVAAMIAKIHQLVSKTQFDVIHADQLWMAQYALAAIEAPHPSSSKLVLDQHNAVHLIPKRLAEAETNFFKKLVLAREAQLLTTYETKICHQFDHVVWVTEEDRQAVASLSDASDTHHGRQVASTVIPICTNPAEVEPVVARTSNNHRVTFLGGLHWPPNAQGILWFAKEVFPKIRAEIPGAVLTIIGKNPPAGLEGAGIEVTGYVVDPMPYLNETAAFIVPLHAGGGMRVKIVEAWGWGIPIVSTTIGAEGIETQHEDNILIADTVTAFAAGVVRLFNEPELTQRLRENGRKTVMEKYNWRVIYPVWDDVYAATSKNSSTRVISQK